MPYDVQNSTEAEDAAALDLERVAEVQEFLTCRYLSQTST